MNPDGGLGPDPDVSTSGGPASVPGPGTAIPEPDATLPELDWSAMFRADLAVLVRHGHLTRAARRVAEVRPGFESLVLDPLWVELRAEGYGAEVDVLQVVRRRPALALLVGRADRVGWIAGVVALVALVFPLWFLALFVVAPARVLAATVHLRLSAPRVLRRLTPAERPAALVYFDVAACQSLATRRHARAKAVLLVVMTLGLYAVLLAASSFLDPVFVIGASAFCVLHIALGAVVLVAARRVQRFGLHTSGEPSITPSSSFVTLPRARAGTDDHPAVAADGVPASMAARVPLPEAVTFTRPRLPFAGLPALVFAMTAVMASQDGSVVGWAIAVPSAVVAALVLIRAWHTKVVITPDGIVDVGVVRTRRYGWDDVALRLVAEPGKAVDGLHLLTAGGRDRLLVTNAAVHGARPDLVRLCEVVTARGRATAPPRVERPSWSSLGGAIGLGLCGAFVSLMALAGLFGGGHASLPVDQVPAGRVYYRYERPDGSLSAAEVDCPPVASWVAGDRDPLCGGPTRAAAVFVVAMASLAAALLAGAVAMARRWRRWRRRRAEAWSSVGLVGAR